LRAVPRSLRLLLLFDLLFVALQGVLEVSDPFSQALRYFRNFLAAEQKNGDSEDYEQLRKANGPHAASFIHFIVGTARGRSQPEPRNARNRPTAFREEEPRFDAAENDAPGCVAAWPRIGADGWATPMSAAAAGFDFHGLDRAARLGIARNALDMEAAGSVPPPRDLLPMRARFGSRTGDSMRSSR
jgi:hypothetical protein